MSRPPHLVLLAADDAGPGSRVRADALAAARRGTRVTLLFAVVGGRRGEAVLRAADGAQVRILRLPVPDPAGDPVVGQDRQSLARRRLAVAQLRLAAATGWTVPVRRRLLEGRRFAVRAQGAGRGRAGRIAGALAEVLGSAAQGLARLVPRRPPSGMDELELAIGPVLDALAPDLVRSEDPRLAAVASRAIARIGARPDATLAAASVQDARAEPAEEQTEQQTEEPVQPPTVCAIGPSNSAGQGWAWGRAIERELPGVRARVIAIRNDRYDFPADELVDPADYRTGTRWQLSRMADARLTWTHALLEAGRPILGGLAGRDFTGDAALLAEAGVRVGLVLHGSETRDPRRHRATHPFSPFADPDDPLTRRLQDKVDALLPRVRAFAAAGGPVFVSTPDQLDDVPEATWLPVVVDPTHWPARADTLRRAVPLVVHAPSNPALKGTATVEAVLRPLAEQGLIEFRLVTGLPPEQAAELVATADVVVDQLLLGLYGVLAGEAMSAGRLVLGHLGDRLRDRVVQATGRPVPVVEATPADLGDVVRRVLADRDWAAAQAADGPAFVRAVHDGRRSAAVLAPFLGRPTTGYPTGTPDTTDDRPAEVPGS